MFPKILELGPVTLHSYGLLLALAFLVATALLANLAERDGVPRGKAWDLGFVVIVSALVGAKLLMVATNWHYYADQPSRFLSLEFWQAGGAFFGGLIGATLGSAWFIRRDPTLRFWKVADAAAPAIALGQAVGRIGCFAAGCDYGRPTHLPWAVVYTSQYAHNNVGVPLNVPVHPVQLYEAFGALLIFLGLYWFHKRRSFSGQVICLYFLSYGMLRFLDEFFRGDVDRGYLFNGLLSIPQAISLVLMAAAAAAYFGLRGRGPKTRRA